MVAIVGGEPILGSSELVVGRRLELMNYSGRAKSDVLVDRWISVRVWLASGHFPDKV